MENFTHFQGQRIILEGVTSTGLISLQSFNVPDCFQFILHLNKSVSVDATSTKCRRTYKTHITAMKLSVTQAMQCYFTDFGIL